MEFQLESIASFAEFIKKLGHVLDQLVLEVVLGIPSERCSTGKIRKAREMQSQGSPIRILCEEEFIELVRASLAEHA